MAARRWYAHITGITVDALAAINPYQWLTSDGDGIVTQTDVTPSRAVVTDANGLPVAATTTATEIGYVNGVTSAIQTQLDAKEDELTFNDTSSIDLTRSTNTITADVKSGGVSLGMLAGGTGSWVYISTVTASSSASVTFTGLTAYDSYKIVMYDVASASDGVNFLWRASTDNGSSYVSTASYGWAAVAVDSAGTVIGAGSASDTSIRLAGSMGNADTTEAGSGEFRLIHRGSGSTVSRVMIDFAYRGSVPSFLRFHGGGTYNVGNDVDAIQFLMSSGNISRGTFRLYGLRES